MPQYNTTLCHTNVHWHGCGEKSPRSCVSVCSAQQSCAEVVKVNRENPPERRWLQQVVEMVMRATTCVCQTCLDGAKGWAPVHLVCVCFLCKGRPWLLNVTRQWSNTESPMCTIRNTAQKGVVLCFICYCGLKQQHPISSPLRQGTPTQCRHTELVNRVVFHNAYVHMQFGLQPKYCFLFVLLKLTCVCVLYVYLCVWAQWYQFYISCHHRKINYEKSRWPREKDTPKYI